MNFFFLHISLILILFVYAKEKTFSNIGTISQSQIDVLTDIFGSLVSTLSLEKNILSTKS